MSHVILQQLPPHIQTYNLGNKQPGQIPRSRSWRTDSGLLQQELSSTFTKDELSRKIDTTSTSWKRKKSKPLPSAHLSFSSLCRTSLMSASSGFSGSASSESPSVWLSPPSSSSGSSFFAVVSSSSFSVFSIFELDFLQKRTHCCRDPPIFPNLSLENLVTFYKTNKSFSRWVLPVSEARLPWTTIAMELRLCDAKMFDTAVIKKSILAAGVTPEVGKLSHTTRQWSLALRTSFGWLMNPKTRSDPKQVYYSHACARAKCFWKHI